MPNCAVITCKNRSNKVNHSKDGISFHIFPKDPKIKEKWIEATGRDSRWFPCKSSTICSAHFKEEMFQPLNKSRRLFEWAVPRLNVCHVVSDLKDVTESSASCSQKEKSQGLKRQHSNLDDNTDEENIKKLKIQESGEKNNHLNSDAQVANSDLCETPRKNLKLKTWLKEKEPEQTNSVISLDCESETGDKSQPSGPSTSNNNISHPKKDPSDKIRNAHWKMMRTLQTLNDESAIMKLHTIVDFLYSIKIFKTADDCDDKLEIYALLLYLSGPLTYNVLRSGLQLPTTKQLKKTYVGVDTVTSFGIKRVLESKINGLAEPDRHCTVCVKKMPLKRFLYYRIAKDKVIGCHDVNRNEVMIPATHAYVMIARGLHAEWEQPLAFCFAAESQPKKDVIAWINTGLIISMEVGYNVAAVVVDHEDLYEHFKNRVVSFAEPYFLLNKRKIYCIFDLPQLIISLRNTLISHELQFLDDDGSQLVADWGTIRDLYTNYEVDNRCLLVPKLTKSHIYPGEAEKKELKYAAQVFSKSVSLALEMDNKRTGLNDTKLRGTQKLVELVNEVFDILNSSASNHHNKCKNAFTGKPNQMKAIRKFMKFLTDVTPNDSFFEDDSFNAIYGLRITIMSFSIMLRDLLPKGKTTLQTHRFNLDAADRFFQAVKRRSETEKPTAIQFYRSFRPIFMTELIKGPSSNGTDDLDNFSQLVNSFKLTPLNLQMIRPAPKPQICYVGTVSYRFQLPSFNGFRYLCWYLLKSCYEFHVCDKVLSEEFQFAENDPRLESYFEPPVPFIRYVKLLDKEMMREFGQNMKTGLATSLYAILKAYRFTTVCPCFPVGYLQKLFIRMRIFQIFRHNNMMFRDESYQFTVDDGLREMCSIPKFDTCPEKHIVKIKAT